jgi:pyrroloquinoline quinone biosynthesis protein D
MSDLASPISATDEATPRLSPGFRLQFEPAQNARVLLYPEGMVKLNGSAGEILARCDGVRNAAQIVADLEQAFQRSGLHDDVLGFLTLAQRQGWVTL